MKFTYYGLKGVNSSSLNASADMGNDGLATNAATRNVARDAVGFSLNYFNGDYRSINATAGNIAMPSHSADAGISMGLKSSSYRPLYNGNISSMAVNIDNLTIPDSTGTGTTSGAMLYNYQYDQLNRLVAMDAYKGLTKDNNSWANIIALPHYQERVTYDGNGNILTYKRNGNKTSQQLMDDLAYAYNRDGNGKLTNNRLRHVTDAVTNTSAYDESDPASGVSDIENQATDNYGYDAIGNLIKDTKENINTINWNVYGKITDINFSFVANKPKKITFTYDVGGNRISKQVETYGATSGTTTSSVYTWYVRDASGNVMAVYNGTGSGATLPATVNVGERDLYGSSRLGVLNLIADSKTLPQAAATSSYRVNFIRGNKYYELRNHLGNVLSTVTDKKIAVDDGTYDTSGVKLNSTPDGKIDYYNADVVTANDYYPFGMLEPGRKYSSQSGYRYGFNGQEKDNDVKGDGNSYGALYWEYDSRISRRWNVDPVTKTWSSPYVCFSDNPIYRIDPLGNSDTTVKGKYYSDNITLSSVVIHSKSFLTPKALERIKMDARSQMTHMYLAGEYEARVKDLIQFAKKSVAQSLGDMLALSRYQKDQITLGNRMIGLISDDDNFKKFEKDALEHLKNGEGSYTSPNTVLLGGDRGSLIGLVIPLPSSMQTMQATVNELTWALRNVYVTATVVHNNSMDGKFIVQYHIEDDFDLVPGGRSGAYNIITSVLGTIYHDWGDNSGPHVTVDWTKKYNSDISY